jgi:hypothetical protein
MLKRDLVVLALAVVGVYFSLQARSARLTRLPAASRRSRVLTQTAQGEGVVSFTPAWSFLHSDDPFLLGEALLPHPVVADLNGDGTREARQSSLVALSLLL